MKKILTVLLIAAMMLTFAGIASAEEPTGTLSIFASKDAWKDGFDEALAQIEANYGISADVTLVADDTFTEVIGVKLATGDVPDIFVANTPQVATQVNAPTNCIVLDDEPWVERLVDPDFLRYSVDGHIYAQPVYQPLSFFGGIYYNKDIMSACGIEDPNPKTFDEFLEICQTVKDAGYIPIWMTDADSWTTQVWTTVGWGVALDHRKDTIYDELLTNKVDFQDVPEIVDVLQKLQDLYNAGYVNEDHLSSSYETSFAALAEGRAAMVVEGEWFVDAAKVAFPDINLGSFAIPFVDGEEPIIGIGAYTGGFWVTSGGNVDLSLRFLDLWSQPEQMDIIYKYQGVPSAYKDIDGGNIDACVQKFITDYVETGKYTYEFDAYFDDARPIMTDYLFGNIVECVSGNKTVEQALTDWNTRYEQFMAEMEYEGF